MDDMSKFLHEMEERITQRVIEHIEAAQRARREDMLLVGAAAIAAELRITIPQFYHAKYNGVFGDAIRQQGGAKGKITAMRSEISKFRKVSSGA